MKRSKGRRFIQLLRACKHRVQNWEATYRACTEQGNTLVEFALSATILFTLVFGVIAMSSALYVYHFVSEAAREGSRYAMVRGSSCSTYGNFASDCPISTTTIPNPIQTYVRGITLPGINPNNLAVTAAWSAYPSIEAACTPSPSCNNPGNMVTVTATYTYVLSIPFVPTRTLTMSSSSKMIIAD